MLDYDATTITVNNWNFDKDATAKLEENSKIYFEIFELEPAIVWNATHRKLSYSQGFALFTGFLRSQSSLF